MKLKTTEIKLRDHEDYTKIVSPKNYQYMYMYMYSICMHDYIFLVTILITTTGI